MKKKAFGLIALSLLCVGALTSCDQGLSIKEGDQIFEGRIVYEAKSSKDVYVRLDVGNKKISKVKCSRDEADVKTDVALKDGILEIKGTFMDKLGAGERRIDIEFDDKSKESIDTIVATKIIKTAEDFNNIRQNLQGTYVLGNDIDLSSIPNFEPLGVYYTETSTRNDYFHGILDGNGYAIKNAKVHYSNMLNISEGTEILDTNSDVYGGTGLFQDDSHKAGDNIGLFQFIGSQGIVRNTVFDNISVRGRTIVGVVAGNNLGLIENCIVTSTCMARMSTHFYDNDCNMGGVVGINGGSGRIRNTICMTSNITVPNIYKDFDDKYKTESGNGWDHVNEPTCNWWKFANVNREKQDYSGDKPASTGQPELDSNGHMSNGVYAFAGKCWGTIENSMALKFNKTVFQATEAQVADFSQTHLGELKPGSGADNMGELNNCQLLTLDEFKSASKFNGFDVTVWNIADGKVPALKAPYYQVTTYTAK